MYTVAQKKFITINRITLITLFLLILAGGIVRSTGSGMGCPDWPKCFDQYIPPTSFSELPQNYQQKYVDKRLEKNERFAKMLEKAGKSDLAFKIRNDQSVSIPEEFNPFKTWTEYLNRLVGAICGVFLLLTFVRSLTLFKISKRITLLSFFNLILVFFQAWLGSIVVSTNLLSWIVTVHMLVALLIVGISIYTLFYASSISRETSAKSFNGRYLSVLVLFALLLSVVQITFGTEVREAVDEVSRQNLQRENWVGKTGYIFNYHRDLAILVLIINVAIYVLIMKRIGIKDVRNKFAALNLVLVILQIITGLTLSYLALPPVAQALHILLASLLFGNQLYLLLLLANSKYNTLKSVIN